MRKIVANPIELRDAIRCEKSEIALTSSFAQVMRPFAELHQNEWIYQAPKTIDEVSSQIEVPLSMTLAMDEKTLNTLFNRYEVALNVDDEQGIELAYVWA
ncbi:hypothetical protein [Enterococcus florum]|nr:hypothetical protein [Enterococcus florum]